MDYKKSIFIVILSIFVLFSVAGICAGDADETSMAVIDADNLKISENNHVIGQSNDFTGADEPANISSEQNAVPGDVLSSGEDNALNADEGSVTVSSFSKLADEIKKASDGDTIVLSYGYYQGGKGDSITIDKEIKILGNGAVLDMYENDNIFTITAKNVVLDDICFVKGSNYEGGAICLTAKSSNCTISNCQFEDNHATRGSAIYDEGSDNKVLNCNFYENRAEYGAIHFRGVNMLISGCDFVQNEATTGGGGVFLAGSGATVVNCLFRENFAKSYAGALQLNYHSGNCSVINSTFISNYVTKSEAGAIAESGSNNIISHCLFSSNYANGDKVTGAAIESTGKYLEISYSNFSSHFAYCGAAIYLGSDSLSCKVTNSIFTRNVVSYSGSAIYDKGSKNQILNSEFYENDAGTGGVCLSGDGATVDNCLFVDNEGIISSTVYLNDTSSYSTVSNSIFINNSADHNGGAIYNNGVSKIINSRFESNSADFGGAIFNNKKLEITCCEFRNNEANLGQNNMTVSGSVSVYSNCGGAILNYGDLTLSYSTFENNTAISCGGAIFNQETLKIADCTFTENGAYYAGAIFNQHDCTVSGSIFEINTAEAGGAIFNNYGTLAIADSTLTDNYAPSYGGAIYNLGTFDGKNTKFKGNHALKAGAIMNLDVSNMEECKFEDNNATDRGGAVYNGGVTFTMVGSTFTGNVAGYGGAIFMCDYGVSLVNCEFVKNTAKTGGAVFILNATLLISASTFTENTASVASAVWTDKADSLMLVNNTRFIDNFNNMNSVLAVGGTLDLSSCEFLYGIYFEIAHIDNVSLNTPFTVEVSAEMRNNVVNGNVIVNIGGENYTVKITDGKGKVTVTPKLSTGKYKATLDFEQEGFASAHVESNEFLIFAKTSYFALNNLIKNAGNTLKLDCDYKYDSASDSEFGDGIVIDKDLTISGNGKTIDGDAKARIFYITSNSKVQISNLNLKNAYHEDRGAAIYNEGDLTIVESDLTNNTAAEGGAIYNDGNLTVTGSVLTNNLAMAGGAIYNREVLNVADSTIWDNYAYAVGGAIHNDGELTVTGAVLANNNATYGGAVSSDGKATIANTTLTNNFGLYGNSIWAENGEDVTITDSRFVDEPNIDDAISSENGEVDTSQSKFQNTVSFEISTINNFISGQSVTIRVTETSRGSEFNGKVTVTIGSERYVVDILNGVGSKAVTSNVDPGKYTAKLTFDETEKYCSATAESNEFKVTKNPNIRISNITDFYEGSSVAIKVLADSLFSGDVAVTIAGVDYVVNVVKGSGSKSITPSLAPGSYYASIAFKGNDKFVAQNVTSNDFNVVKKVSTNIQSANVNTVYNGGKYLVATLKDDAGNPIKDVEVTIRLTSTRVFTKTSDKKGVVKVSTDGLDPKTYTAKISFAGKDKYAASSKSVNVVVKKASTKLTASNKQFKVKATKKLTATLKDSKNKVIKNKYVTFKFKGKTYKVKTSSKGVASKTFSVSKKGTYKVTVKFAGDKCYKATSKTIKFVVK